MIKKLLPLLLLILIGCSEPESEPVDINLLDYKLDGSYQYLNEPYSGPFFQRVTNEKYQLTEFYFLGAMVNGVKHGVIKKNKDGSDIPILEDSYNNGRLVGPLIFYDSNGIGYPIDDSLFDVLSLITSYGDTLDYDEPDGYRLFFDSKNQIIRAYTKTSKSGTLSLESLKNIDIYGREYNKWYRWFDVKVNKGWNGTYNTKNESYFYSEYVRDLIDSSSSLLESSIYSFRLIKPYRIELTIEDRYIDESKNTTEKFILVPLQDNSFDLSISEVNIPTNIEYLEEIDSVFQKKSRILKESQDD